MLSWLRAQTYRRCWALIAATHVSVAVSVSHPAFGVGDAPSDAVEPVCGPSTHMCRSTAPCQTMSPAALNTVKFAPDRITTPKSSAPNGQTHDDQGPPPAARCTDQVTTLSLESNPNTCSVVGLTPIATVPSAVSCSPDGTTTNVQAGSEINARSAPVCWCQHRVSRSSDVSTILWPSGVAYGTHTTHLIASRC